MQYLFSLLVLGDSISAVQYIDQGKLTNESQDQELSQMVYNFVLWGKSMYNGINRTCCYSKL